MSRFNRIQQHLSLTRKESTTILALSIFLLLGVGVRYYQRHLGPGPEAYAEDMRLFRELTAAITDESVESETIERHPEPAMIRPNTGATPAEMSGSGSSIDGGSPPERREPDRGTPSVRLNPNTATEEELIRIPRIGPATARRIMDFRRAYGPFTSIDDLIEVRGIGVKTLEIIRPYLVVPEPETNRPP